MPFLTHLVVGFFPPNVIQKHIGFEINIAEHSFCALVVFKIQNERLISLFIFAVARFTSGRVTCLSLLNAGFTGMCHCWRVGEVRRASSEEMFGFKTVTPVCADAP